MQKDRREGKAIAVLYLIMGKFQISLCLSVCLSVCVCLFHQQLKYQQADHIAAIITDRQHTALSVSNGTR